jgi:LDH2 family malate/lactate/ureidoglycolate dehydrogenase
MEAAVEMAKSAGVGIVTVFNGNHAGAFSTYSELAVEAGMIGVALCNAQPAIPPWGGRQAFFGTNPIAVAAPCGEHPVSIDMATSVVARGKIILAAKRGEPIPDGWALNEFGMPTNDATSALRGAVLPMAGPKGYGLALAVEILSGVLSGAKVANRVGSIYDEEPGFPGTGMFIMALNPDYFVGAATFADRIRQLSDDIHAVPPAAGHDRVMLPGERRRATMQVRIKDGIPLSAETVQELVRLARDFGVEMPVTEEK